MGEEMIYSHGEKQDRLWTLQEISKEHNINYSALRGRVIFRNIIPFLMIGNTNYYNEDAKELLIK